MDAIQQNTLYLTTAGTYIGRDHLTLQVEVPIYPETLPAEERTRDKSTGNRKLSVPIHHLESVQVRQLAPLFNQIANSPFPFTTWNPSAFSVRAPSALQPSTSVGNTASQSITSTILATFKPE